MEWTEEEPEISHCVDNVIHSHRKVMTFVGKWVELEIGGAKYVKLRKTSTTFALMCRKWILNHTTHIHMCIYKHMYTHPHTI